VGLAYSRCKKGPRREAEEAAPVRPKQSPHPECLESRSDQAPPALVTDEDKFS
jgi:hypothetical protein